MQHVLRWLLSAALVGALTEALSAQEAPPANASQSSLLLGELQHFVGEVAELRQRLSDQPCDSSANAELSRYVADSAFAKVAGMVYAACAAATKPEFAKAHPVLQQAQAISADSAVLEVYERANSSLGRFLAVIFDEPTACTMYLRRSAQDQRWRIVSYSLHH